MAKHTIQELQQWQALPLNIKVLMTKERIRNWVNEYGEDGVYVSLSGGKDSTVLLTIARQLYPNLKAVFVDTGLEYPEIREFVKTWDNVDWVKPKMTFRQVIEKYGYPFISKEVAECVWGARKYLTGVLEQESLDRQTDRQTCRIGTGSSGSWEPVSIRVGEAHENRPICNKMGGGEVQQETLSSTSITGLMERSVEKTPPHGVTEPLPESSRLKTHLTSDYAKAIDNYRIQRLMGILPMKGKATKETIPSKPDRSMYSCERYQFFLDAPFEIGQQCCGVMKKAPMNAYHKETGRQPITAMMASESRLRTQKWLQQGCNAFDAKKPMSMPMAFWTEQDVLLYLYNNQIPIASVYGDIVIDYEGAGQVEGQMSFRDLGGDWEMFDSDRPLLKTTGVSRSGCMFCGFGCHLEKPGEGRFERMKVTHPKLYDYIMRPKEKGGLNYKEVIDWINEHGNLHIRY